MDPVLVHQPLSINITPRLLGGTEGSDPLPPPPLPSPESKTPGGTGNAWFLRLPPAHTLTGFQLSMPKGWISVGTTERAGEQENNGERTHQTRLLSRKMAKSGMWVSLERGRADHKDEGHKAVLWSRSPHSSLQWGRGSWRERLCEARRQSPISAPTCTHLA